EASSTNQIEGGEVAPSFPVWVWAKTTKKRVHRLHSRSEERGVCWKSWLTTSEGPRRPELSGFAFHLALKLLPTLEDKKVPPYLRPTSAPRTREILLFGQAGLLGNR
ncbi:RIKEN cDNA E130006D01, partial [Mus musculus]